MSKFVVYTAVTPGYDRLKPPPELWLKEAEFVAFLDEPTTVPGWQSRPIYRRFRDPCRNAKIHKLLPHKYFPEAEYSLWIDGTIGIKSPLPLRRWPQTYLRHHDLALFKHRLRNCVYQEAHACLALGLDDPKKIHRQIQRYFDEGYPVENGLAECMVLFRRHTRAMQRFDEAWYDAIKTGSRRDQLSFNYVAHQLGFQYNYLPGKIWDNPHFTRGRHLAPRTAGAQR